MKSSQSPRQGHCPLGSPGPRWVGPLVDPYKATSTAPGLRERERLTSMFSPSWEIVSWLSPRDGGSGRGRQGTEEHMLQEPLQADRPRPRLDEDLSRRAPKEAARSTCDAIAASRDSAGCLSRGRNKARDQWKRWACRESCNSPFPSPLSPWEFDKSMTFWLHRIRPCLKGLHDAASASFLGLDERFGAGEAEWRETSVATYLVGSRQLHITSVGDLEPISLFDA